MGSVGFYFLTFGGFVAFSIYLPTLLRDQFGLSITDAGLRTAGFVVLATLLRPVGGDACLIRSVAPVYLSGVFRGSGSVCTAVDVAIDDSVYGGRSGFGRAAGVG